MSVAIIKILKIFFSLLVARGFLINPRAVQWKLTESVAHQMTVRYLILYTEKGLLGFY